jgi:hypothetical protein
MRWLAAGVPLTLLIDLCSGADSRELYATERAATDWIEPRVA